jgi:hypothetical protein
VAVVFMMDFDQLIDHTCVMHNFIYIYIYIYIYTDITNFSLYFKKTNAAKICMHEDDVSNNSRDNVFHMP